MQGLLVRNKGAANLFVGLDRTSHSQPTKAQEITREQHKIISYIFRFMRIRCMRVPLLRVVLNADSLFSFTAFIPLAAIRIK